MKELAEDTDLTPRNGPTNPYRLPAEHENRGGGDGGHRKAWKNGLRPAKDALLKYGSRAINKRTRAGREWKALYEGFADEAGGIATLDTLLKSEAEGLACELWAIRKGEAWLLNCPNPVRHAKRSVLPIVGELRAMKEAFTRRHDRWLRLLEKRKQTKRAPSFADYTHSKGSNRAYKPAGEGKQPIHAQPLRFEFEGPQTIEFDANETGSLDEPFPTPPGVSGGLPPLPKTSTSSTEPQERHVSGIPETSPKSIEILKGQLVSVPETSPLSKVPDPPLPVSEISGEKVFRCARCKTLAVFDESVSRKFCARCQAWQRFELDEKTTVFEVKRMEREDEERRRRQECRDE